MLSREGDILWHGDVCDEGRRLLPDRAPAMLQGSIVPSVHELTPPRPQKTMFGVFDGHGGKFVARKCSEHCWVDEEDIEERFWKLDETLGPQSLSSGTTASIMVINHVDGDDFSVTLAWVGDSQIMEIDVLLRVPCPINVQLDLHEFSDTLR